GQVRGLPGDDGRVGARRPRDGSRRCLTSRPTCSAGSGARVQHTPRDGAARVYRRGVDRDNALGEYLSARRALVTPASVGLPTDPGRRVPGLRREEVALLAGVSTDYYLRL